MDILDAMLKHLAREADLEWLLIDSTIVRAHCLIPDFDGASSAQAWKDALWDKVSAGAPDGPPIQWTPLLSP